MRKNYKLFLGILIGVLMSVTGVYAATIIKSKEVSYDNKSSGGKYTNVQDSIDELYEKVKDAYKIHDTIWKDPVLNGADPVLEVEGSTKKLIPITLDNDGTVHYANLYSEWYDYSDKRWANAVILVDNPKNGGDEKYTYKTGDVIDENDIESYFVWIPRYSYKIWTLANTEEYANVIDGGTITNANKNLYKLHSNTRIIDIKFGDSSTNSRMNESEAKLNEYYTHPAFTLDSKDLAGIWVGKFETGYNQDGDNGEPLTIDNKWTAVGAQQNKVISNRIIIKPNVYSWRYNTVQNFFLSSFNYARELESHMMKNTEWGAVAYLSHSAYGIGNKININNNSQHKTGYSATSGIKENTDDITNLDDITDLYNEGTGYLASTTGNITGVYDMSGGVWEYMAAYVSGQVGMSGFELPELTETYSDYFDVYNSNSTSSSFNNRILGDATGEMGPFYKYYGESGQNNIFNSWYADYSNFVNNNVPWFDRGGLYSNIGIASQFYFSIFNGRADGNFSFRLVLSPS